MHEKRGMVTCMSQTHEIKTGPSSVIKQEHRKSECTKEMKRTETIKIKHKVKFTSSSKQTTR